MSPVFERTELERFRDVVSRRLGLSFDDTKLDQLANVLHDRMRATGCNAVSPYLDRLDSPVSSRAEVRELAEYLTVAETYFFRHPDQIQAFADLALPERIQAQAARRQLRILSAGCSSGEEPYTLAMMVREHLPDLSSWHIEIIGCDVNASMLKKAKRAVYSEWSLRNTSEPIRQRYFRQHHNEFALDENVKSMVSFENENLTDRYARIWKNSSFDIVFCRNVLMYFTEEATQSVAERVAESLIPGGFFFIGPAETLRGVSHSFHLCHTNNAFYYKSWAIAQPLPVKAAPAVPAAPERSSVSAVLDPNTSWLDTIASASARITALSRVPAMPPPEETCPSWDLALATELLREERYHDAIQALRSLPPESEKDPDAQLLLAAVLTHRGDIGEAEQVCRRVLTLDELNAGAHYLMALCREHAGDVPAAWEHDQTAAYLDPVFAMPHLHLGLLAKAQRRVELSRQEFRRAKTLLLREDASRILLFGGGFNREALIRLCRAEMQAAGGVP